MPLLKQEIIFSSNYFQIHTHYLTRKIPADYQNYIQIGYKFFIYALIAKLTVQIGYKSSILEVIAKLPSSLLKI